MSAVTPSASAPAVRDLLGVARVPPGLPPLRVPVHLGVAVLDDPAASVGVVLGPGWSVTTTGLSPDLVHDAVLAAPSALIRDILTGAEDIGRATVDGSVTGSLVGQSVLAFLVEATAACQTGRA